MGSASSKNSESESVRRKRSPRRRRQDRVAVLRNRIRPLKILLLSRKHRRTSGGIGRSALMIVKALKEVGDEVRLRSCNQPLDDIPSGTDLIWHYGDFDHLDQQVNAAELADIPIIINSTYDHTADKRQWMIHQAESWSHPRAYWVVFSEEARHDVRLRRIRDRLVSVPKTIRLHENVDHWKAYGQRRGICIGELEKLRRARLVRGMNIQEAVDELRTALPDIPLFCYDQYSTPATVSFEGVEVVKPEKDMMKFLGSLRLFVSFTSHETFSMVPCEAQHMGTPVLYRPMPQSLSEHFGMTAYPFTTIDELVLGVMKLHEDERLWTLYSTAGCLNAEARSVASVAPALDLALRKVIFR